MSQCLRQGGEGEKGDEKEERQIENQDPCDQGLSVETHSHTQSVFRDHRCRRSQAVSDRFIMENAYSLHIRGKWVDQFDLEAISLRETVKIVHIDVYVCALWYQSQ